MDKAMVKSILISIAFSIVMTVMINGFMALSRM